MHGDALLGGPVFWAVLALFYGAGLMALFVVVDACRSCRAEAFKTRAARLLWVAPQAFFVVLFFVGALPQTAAPTLSFAVVIAAPLVIGLQFMYLLRVVYPKPSLLAVTEDEALIVTTDPEE